MIALLGVVSNMLDCYNSAYLRRIGNITGLLITQCIDSHHCINLFRTLPLFSSFTVCFHSSAALTNTVYSWSISSPSPMRGGPGSHPLYREMPPGHQESWTVACTSPSPNPMLRRRPRYQAFGYLLYTYLTLMWIWTEIWEL